MGNPDILTGPKPSTRPWFRRPALYLGVILVVAAAVVWLDHRERSQEFDQMVACWRAGQDAVDNATGGITAMSQYVRPALGSTPSQLVRAGLERLVQEAAARGVPVVQQARQECVGVSVRPWHREIRQAKTSYVEYLEEFLAYLDAAARNSDVLYVEHPELQKRLLDARAALTASVPGGRESIPPGLDRSPTGPG